MSPRKYTPTPEQRDEKVNTEVDAEKLIKAVLRAGRHPREADEKPKKGPEKVTN